MNPDPSDFMNDDNGDEVYDDDDDPDYIPPTGEDDEEEDEEDIDMQEADIRTSTQGLLVDLFRDDDGGARIPISALVALLRQNRATPRAREELDTAEDREDPAGWCAAKRGYKDSTVPLPGGLELQRSGEFGRVGPLHHVATPLLQRMRDSRRRVSKLYKEDLSRDLIPNTNGTVVATYDAKPYVGQFSEDSRLYYTGCQDFNFHVYDFAIPPRQPTRVAQNHYPQPSTTMSVTRTVRGSEGQWTVTDSHLSPDNSALLYSSLTSTMYMTKMDDESDEQIPIPLGDTTQRRGYWGNYGFPIYSCRFSTDGKEIVAGGRKDLFVFDLGSMQRVLSISAHSDDINSCCWADTRSGNVLVSASDDTTLKVWDRRSLGKSNKPSGVLIGHTEGLTHVGPKGDGRYVISNGKDQVLRLWDLRKMRTHNEWNGGNPYGHEMFDYRDGRYPKPNFKKHPLDTSVMSYKGHAVLRTLIRCHFSPAETTGSSYIYSGSYDGKIHIWSLDGRVVQVLDRSKTLPISFHPSESDVGTRSSDRMAHVVRDVSWHSQEPILMSCAWDGEYEYAGSVARHEWKGYGRNALTIEDVVERDELNTAHAAQMALPGGLLSELRRHS